MNDTSSILPNEKPPKTFQHSLGVALSCLGAAVGTGNIWRYPRIVANNTGENGALGFVLIWLMFLFTWSIPMLLIEYGAGRYTKVATIMTFKQMIGPKTMWCGAFIGFVNFAIASYYAAICGWCAYYFVYFIVHPLPSNLEESQLIFSQFVESSAWPVLFQAIVIMLGSLCVLSGVRSIELAMLIIVPVLLVLMLFSFIYSLTLENASIGIKHLFSMDWQVFMSPTAWIEALTQNAWDTGAAQGILLVYATYLSKHHGVVRYGTVIPSINNLLSFLMAITMFSTVFSVHMAQDPTITVHQILHSFAYNAPGNTGLTFIWIPLLYARLSIGRVITALFFLCLLLAGFSSQVSMIEASCHQLVDLKVPRKCAVLLICILLFLFGLGSALSIHFLVNQDFVWGSAIMLSGALLLFLVIRFGVSKFRQEVVNAYSDGSDWYLPRVWEWIILILIPLQIFGIFIWWIVNNIMSKNHAWYDIMEESLLTAIVQWSVIFLIVISLNFLYLKYGDRILSAVHAFPMLPRVALPAVSSMTPNELSTSQSFALADISGCTNNLQNEDVSHS